MEPSARPYYRQDESELHEALSHLTGLKWYQTDKLRRNTVATTEIADEEDVAHED